MATNNIHQPLLNSSASKKVLITTLSLFAIAFSIIFFLAPNFISSVQHPHLCIQNPQSCLQNTFLIYTSLPQIKSAIKAATAVMITHQIQNNQSAAAFSDCLELMDMSTERINSILYEFDVENAHAWLSGILTNHFTCLDGINFTSHANKLSIEILIQDLISRTRTALAAISRINSAASSKDISGLNGGFPSWVSAKDRKLLQRRWSDFSVEDNVVVAKDGSGDYITIQEAVDFAPNKSKTRFVIYVKKGTYKENVEVGKKKKNVMIVGDGMDSSIITGSLNVVDGSTTFRSATLAVAGDGFILQDIWVQNTAGPEKHQAVALRVSADQAVINRCQIDAYQDTLYTHTYRQFYRECYIIGTVDFIFGNAAVVLQKCQIVARKPMSNQKNMVTAQGRVDPNQNTGTSIQDCEIIPSSDLEPVQNLFPTYLGRPWKEYSRTVVMQSYIGGHIDPAGWAEWSGDFAFKTLYYGEYANRGPGAGTSKRVNWVGYHVITDPKEASQFTVAELIQGGEWLGSTGVSYTEGL